MNFNLKGGFKVNLPTIFNYKEYNCSYEWYIRLDLKNIIYDRRKFSHHEAGHKIAL